MRTILVVLMLGVSGCNLIKRGTIRSGAVTVTGLPDAGKAASLAESHSAASLPIPAGSKLVVTKWEPVAWKPATATSPEIKAQPAREVTEVVLAKDSTWNRTETQVQADTGTVDTSIAQHRIDVAENRILLYAALGAAALGIIFRYIGYPTPANMCFAASAVFAIAWKVAGLPEWFWAVGACAIVGGVLLWRGYERRDKEAKEHAEELAKAKALAVPAAPPVPVVVTNPSTPSP